MIVTGLDIETTGLMKHPGDLGGQRIIEICMICYNLADRKEKLRYVQRIDPERSITAKAQEVHGIDITDLAGKPVFKSVSSMITKILSKSALVVAHNGEDFDGPFLALELLRVGEEPPNFTIFDTMKKARWATTTGKVPSLRELCFACDVDYDLEKAHGAAYDVEVMMECLWRGQEFGFYHLPHA